MLLPGLQTDSPDPSIARAGRFMSRRMESLDQSAVASRLQLNCARAAVDPVAVAGIPVTIIDVFDESALKTNVRSDGDLILKP